MRASRTALYVEHLGLYMCVLSIYLSHRLASKNLVGELIGSFLKLRRYIGRSSAALPAWTLYICIYIYVYVYVSTLSLSLSLCRRSFTYAAKGELKARYVDIAEENVDASGRPTNRDTLSGLTRNAKPFGSIFYLYQWD